MIQKRLLVLLLCCLLPQARAQLQIIAPASATCSAGDGKTPVLGISVDSSFEGEGGEDYADVVAAALQDAGFHIARPYTYRLLDEASISVGGLAAQWRSSNGSYSSRVGKVRLNVTDLSTDTVLFTFAQDPRLVFQAPTRAAFAQMIVSGMGAKFCQSSRS